MQRIPFLDLRRLHRSIQSDLDAAIERVVSNAAFVGGAEVRRFEEAFGAAHHTGEGAGCGSGTDALSLALRALGVGPGDEVVVPAMTFVATAEAAVHVGATPVVADVDPDTLLLTPETVDAVTTERTRAVIPVHLYGHVVPFTHLQHWRDQGLLVVEDAAQAHLGTDEGRFIGSVGHAACFSFYPGKNLGAFGDGGMVISSSEALIDEIRRIRDHGRTSKYTHDIVGYCSRLDGLQAAILGAKLQHLPRWTSGRVEAAERYREHLDASLVPWRDGAVHHLLVARTIDPDTTREDLDAEGIASGLHYPVALSQQPWLAPTSAPAPHAERAAATMVSLPMDPLMTLEEVDRVASVVAPMLIGATV